MTRNNFELSVYQYNISQTAEALRKIGCAKQVVQILEMAVVEIELQIRDISAEELSKSLKRPEDVDNRIMLQSISYRSITDRMAMEP